LAVGRPGEPTGRAASPLAGPPCWPWPRPGPALAAQASGHQPHRLRSGPLPLAERHGPLGWGPFCPPWDIPGQVLGSRAPRIGPPPGPNSPGFMGAGPPTPGPSLSTRRPGARAVGQLPGPALQRRLPSMGPLPGGGAPWGGPPEFMGGGPPWEGGQMRPPAGKFLWAPWGFGAWGFWRREKPCPFRGLPRTQGTGEELAPWAAGPLAALGAPLGPALLAAGLGIQAPWPQMAARPPALLSLRLAPARVGRPCGRGQLASWSQSGFLVLGIGPVWPPLEARGLRGPFNRWERFVGFRTPASPQGGFPSSFLAARRFPCFPRPGPLLERRPSKAPTWPWAVSRAGTPLVRPRDWFPPRESGNPICPHFGFAPRNSCQRPGPCRIPPFENSGSLFRFGGAPPTVLLQNHSQPPAQPHQQGLRKGAGPPGAHPHPTISAGGLTDFPQPPPAGLPREALWLCPGGPLPRPSTG